MCIYDDSRRFARLEWRSHDTFVTRTAHKLLDLWQDAGDDRVDASGGRMKAVAGGEFGIDRFEIAPIVGAEIGRGPHAGEQYGHVPDGEAAHDLRERLT